MKKPFDIGDGYSCASLLPGGEWLAITRPHALHGMVELTGAESFDEGRRGNQTYVRAYRAALTRADSAFLVPTVSGGTLRVERGVDSDGSLWERLLVTRNPQETGPVRVRLEFRGRLQRPPYAEITDTAPLEPLEQDSRLAVDGSRLMVASELLGSRAEIVVESTGGGDGEGGTWIASADSAVWQQTWSPDAAADASPDTLTIRCRLHTQWDPARSGDDAGILQRARPLQDEHRDSQRLNDIVDGSRAYILDCCALRTGSGESVLLTDHRLLPLSWTRDAYYAALLLLLAGDEKALRTVEAHLRWLWGPGRKSGAWMRSHLTNGAVKDPGLQADQQLYPILELVNFREATGAWPVIPAGVTSWGVAVDGALGTLPREPSTGLLESEENPADDPSDFSLSFSTQVLFVHVLERLVGFSDELGLDPIDLRSASRDLRAAIDRVFVVDGPEGLMFAYEADGRGGFRLYGDANDLPTALAVSWGFCSAQNQVWQRTMRYILSPANAGWSRGPFGGLGSAHTPGTWPLGDFQSYIFHREVGEHAEAQRMLDRLVAVAASDGLLPETYDSGTGEWWARHWFAWPGAVWASGLLEPRLTVTPFTQRRSIG